MPKLRRELHRISPFRCCMWPLHDRLGENQADGAHRVLVESMRSQGQKQPTLGRHVRDGSEYDVELIYGARRLAAARELGVDLLVEIRDIDDRDALVEMDIENRVREDISAYERGLSYRRWLQSGLFSTQAEVAKALGVSEAQICRLLKYSELPAVVVAAFGSPNEIREEWAGTLSTLCKDPTTRDGLLRRARSMGSPSSLSSSDVYQALLCDRRRSVVGSRSKDEIVKGPTGENLFRIGFRARTVHLILPRDMLSRTALAEITKHLTVALESVDGT